MLETLRSLLRPPSPEEKSARELDQARHALLEALSAREYADCMVQYHERRINRLRATLEQDAKEF